MTTLTATHGAETGYAPLTRSESTRPDGAVLLIVGLLMALGAAMVFSASVTIDGVNFEGRSLLNTSLRQCLFAVGGFFVMLFTAHVDYRLLAWHRPRGGLVPRLLLLTAVVLLIAVLVPGVGVSRLGAQRSIQVLSSPVSLSFQPAEFAKVALLVWLAALLARVDFDIRVLRRGFLPAVLGIGLIVGLIGVEDFGTAALLGVVAFCLLLAGGARFWHLASCGVLAGVAGAGLVLMKPYRVERLLTFFSSDPDASGEGYQVTQSLIAIASGGWWGHGLGAGVQKYGYLPQDNNDFILAIVCEELGIAGGLAVVGLFLLLLIRGAWIARRCRDAFGRLLAVGVTLLITLQAAFNIGVVTNSVPTKGISLPFVSAGGSGVLFLGLAAGLLASIGSRSDRVPDSDAPEAAGPPPGSG